MKKIIIMIYLALFSMHTYAITCEISSDKSPVTYYVNGVLSSSSAAQNSIVELKRQIRSTQLNTVRHAANATRGVYDDLVEAAEQRQAEPMAITRWLANINLAPAWFKRKYADSIVRTANVQHASNFDLRNMTEKFLAALRSGRKVVLVAHSQGNFFANAAYQYISQNHPQYRNSIGLVAVGSPSSRVQDGGVHFRNSYDLVISTVDIFYSVLPSNFIYTSVADLSGHLFIDTYLKARGSAIGSAVVNTANRLTTPPLHNSCDPTSRAEVETLIDLIPGVRTADFSARLTKGDDAKVWVLYSLYSDQVECNKTQYQGSQTYDAVSVVTEKPTNLQPQSNYYYRACAIGKDDVLVSGSRLSVRTQPLILDCGQSLSVTGGSNGYTAFFRVGVNSGNSIVTFQTFTIPDRLTITDTSTANRVLLETGYVSGLNRYTVFKPTFERLLKVRVIGNNIETTKWELSMTCP